MVIVNIGLYPISANCICGGVEASVYGLTQELAKTHIVHVFDVPRMGEKDRVEIYENMTIHRYANPGTHNKDAVRRVGEIFNQIITLRPTICHIHGTGVFSKQIYFALKQLDMPVIVTVHGMLREEKRQALVRKPSLKHLYQYIVQSRNERALLNDAPEVIVDTAYVADKLRTYKLRHVPKIHVIPQGIDEAYYEINCNPQSHMILSVGAISPRKGHSITIDMFHLLRRKGIEAKLRIIGSLTDKEYYDILQQKITNSPYQTEISLETNLPKTELLKAYASSKLFVLHSREESQGIVFAEAMATGLPVVATMIGGIPYVVVDGKSGLLCPYGNVEAMADMVALLMKDKKKWDAFSAEARITAQEYIWSSIAKQIENIYMSISK